MDRSNGQPLVVVGVEASDRPVSPAGQYDPVTQRWSYGTGARSTRTGALSRRQKVMVVTEEFDPHADAVITALEQCGVESLRINSADLLNLYSVTWSSYPRDGGSFVIADRFGRQICSPPDVLAGYYRTPLPVMPHTQIRRREFQELATREGDSFLECLYAADGIPWISRPDLIRRAEAKVPQLQLARALGLEIPRTIITNNPQEAREFAETVRYNLITKTLATTTVNGVETSYDIFAQRLTRAAFEESIASVQLVPTVLQEYVPKVAEIRVTIMGADIYATEIDSQSVEEAMVDWRQVNPLKLRYTPVSLPPPLAVRLRRFLEHYGMFFGAIDLIRTLDSQYVFLENNPNGQWYWIEFITGLPMAARMARLLIEGAEDKRAAM